MEALFIRNSASAQTFVKIVDSFDPLPDQPGDTFFILGWGAPALRGDRMVFASAAGQHHALWSALVTGGSLIRLVDTNTAMPRTASKFGEVHPFRLSGGKAVFRGTDYAGHSGCFSVPVRGSGVGIYIATLP
jgi:hypothetical protein